MNNICLNEETFTEEELINHFIMYSLGYNEEEEKIIKHNLKLVSFIIRKYYSTFNDYEELFQIGLISLTKAVRTFDFIKGIKFSTYASKIIINDINLHIRRESRTNNNISLNSELIGNENLKLEDTLEDKTFNLESIYEEKELRNFIRESLKVLSDTERKVIEYRFGFTSEPMTQVHVGKILGCSQAYILKVERKALKKLKEVLIKNEYMENNKTLALK